MKETDIARLCHEANRAYCESLGDDTQPYWEHAPEWQQASALVGVRMHLKEPRSPKQSHQAWMEHKLADGWVYGEVKDAEAKTHPCMVPYEELPPEQRVKDIMFKAIVEGFKGELE